MKLKKFVGKKVRSSAVLLGLVLVAASMSGTVLKAEPKTEVKEDDQDQSVNQNSNVGNTMSNNEQEDTLYGVGSVSKMFTTVAIMQLVDEGKITLDEPITTYLPEFHMADERYKQITTRMLLNHSSGLMGSSFSNNMLYDDNDTIAHDTLLEKLSSQKLKADPGLYGTYCNDGFRVAELIVERVSGHSFTEYLEDYIFDPLEMKSSGTPINRLGAAKQVETYLKDSILYAPDYCNVIGTGGVLSTAEELCKFGRTFTANHNSLLSDEALQQMATAAFDKDSYGYIAEGSWENYGLGWDSVDAYPFNTYGTKALIKGGDLENQHGILMVLPKENISISVLSSGGSGTFNGLLAEELAKLALEEEGGPSEEKLSEPVTSTVDQVPEKYLSYEGNYANNGNIYHLSFPNGEYLKLESCNKEIEKVQAYHYTEGDYFISDDNQFISSTGELSLPSSLQSGKTRLSLKTEKDGKQYLCMDSLLTYAEIGDAKVSGMFAEKLQANPVREEVLSAWKARDGKKYYLTSEKYSSTFWNMGPVMKLKLSTDQSGYINGYGNMNVAKIVSKDKAEPFVTLSGQMGSDLNSISVIKQGKDELIHLEDSDFYYIDEASIPELDLSKESIELTKSSAQWYNIGKTTQKKKVILEPDKQMAVYIYDQYDQCIYSTYMKNVGKEVILPKEGKMVVIGQSGSSLSIQEN